MTAGYSGKPLITKLGIKAGFSAIFLNAPENYTTLLGALPDDVTVSLSLDSGSKPADFIHFFTRTHIELEDQFPPLKAALALNGMLWISWPKASSKVPTDLNENVIREIGLANGLVDVKVAAIDEIWSGLKFVYRLEDRK